MGVVQRGDREASERSRQVAMLEQTGRIVHAACACWAGSRRPTAAAGGRFFGQIIAIGIVEGHRLRASLGVERLDQFDPALGVLQELVTAVEPADPLLVRGQRIAKAELAAFELGDDLFELGERLLEAELFGFGFRFFLCHFSSLQLLFPTRPFTTGSLRHEWKEVLGTLICANLR